MKVAEINEMCQTQLFKDVLSDMMYSFRQSIQYLTEGNIDIKLTKIRVQPITFGKDATKVEGKIRNLVGGKISCVVDKPFVEFINSKIEVDEELYESPIDCFMDNVFDTFSNVAKNGVLELGLNESGGSHWDSNKYFIQYNMKVINESNVAFQSKLIVGVDEMTTLYFKD